MEGILESTVREGDESMTKVPEITLRYIDDVEGFTPSHLAGGKRWVYTSELGQVKIEGDDEAYITLVDDAINEVSKINELGYFEVSYSQVKKIPRIIEGIKARMKYMKTKRDFWRAYHYREKIRRDFIDVFDDPFSQSIDERMPIPELRVEKPDGYTKEYVSQVLDSVNQRNGVTWSFVS